MYSGDHPICGYQEADMILCRSPRKMLDNGRMAKRCEKHDLPRYAICEGCAGEAIRECGAGRGCTAPVCENCRHVPEDHTHTSAPQPAFAGQRPGPSQAELARIGMIDAVANSLGDLEQRGYLTLNPAVGDDAKRIAGVLVDELATHVLVQMMSGVIAGQVNP